MPKLPNSSITKFWVPLVLIFLLAGCASYEPWYNKDIRETWTQNEPQAEKPYYSLFLVGDCGKAGPEGNEPVMNNLTETIRAAGNETAVVFLGDNIYHYGLPGKNAPDREHAEEAFTPQLDVIKNTPAQGIVVPGNHDWQSGGEDGLKRVGYQEKFVKKYLNDKHVFYPKDGCPGPEPIFLGKDIMVLAIDTQWWIHRFEKPNHEYDCAVKVNADLIKMIEDEIQNNQDKKIIVVGHHPMYTYGEHGGHFSPITHLFPFTYGFEKAYVPLPILGSLHPVLRKYWGHEQDTRHPKYNSMIEELTGVFEKYPNLTYASGHDHNMQYFPKGEQHFIVSGTGAKSNYVGHGKDAHFTTRIKGFSRMDFYENGEVWVEFLDARESGKTEVIFREKMYTFTPPPKVDPTESGKSYADQSITQAIDPVYADHGGLHTGMLGKNYREEWATPIEFPVLDLWAEGYEILKRGGGMQTRSLRIQNKEGQQFSLRSLRKYPEFAVPEPLQGTVAATVVQDQISSSHPLAFLAVPPLAEAANVYHANPKIFYLPDDPRLGIYQEDFGGEVYMMEERPAGDRSDVPTFGRSKKMISTFKMMQAVQEDHDKSFDSRWTVKSRLFDMWLGDWDRHDDQWRWGAYEVEGKTVYRPVPRDRDQVFFKMGGAIPFVAIRPYGIRNIHSFETKIRDVVAYSNNSRFFDRSFTVEADWEDWQIAIDSLQMVLTDEKIEEGLAGWPEAFNTLNGAEVTEKLKVRRENMDTWARDYYETLAKTVEVLGSDQREYFRVERKPEGNTLVQVYKHKKKGKKKGLIYEREFLPKETREIRIYGLDGKDEFEVLGEASRGHRIRLIGGQGKDTFSDVSKVKGLGKKTKIYDKKKKTELDLGKESKNLTSNQKSVNEYFRKGFKFNYAAPLLAGGFNPDDGILIGLGFLSKTEGFRKTPYASSNTVTGAYAFATGSFNFTYKGVFPKVVGGWDLGINADIKAPNYVTNFMGLGNETPLINGDDLSYHRVRYQQAAGQVMLQKTDKEDKFTFGWGAEYDQGEVEATAGRFITNFDDNGLDSTRDFETRRWAGPVAKLRVDTRDNAFLPTRGFVFKADGTWKKALVEDAEDFGKFTYDMSFYFTPNYKKALQTTLAFRFGGGNNIGAFPFFRAQTLGGLTNLRGYRKTRFAGRHAFYQNTELRIKLFDLKTPIFPAQVGLIGLNDIGRVWQDNETSNQWHWGYGGGVFLTPFDVLTITGTYSFSEEMSIANIKVGFQF